VQTRSRALVTRALVATWVAFLTAVLATPAWAGIGSDTDGDEAHLREIRDTYRQRDHDVSQPTPPELRLVEWAHAQLCNVDSPYLEPGIDGPCWPPDGTVPVPECDEDDPLEPLWRRSRLTVDSEWSRWEMKVGWICPDDLLPVVTEEQFRTLKILSPPPHRQPATGDVLVNKPLIVFTEDVERTFRTSLFGMGIDVVATPLEYTWDFGDGTTLTTTSPGEPYPSFELTHDYAEAMTATVTLTTTWEGRYRVDEDPDGEWRDIDGTAVTTTTLDPFEVIELRTRLVG
jgi:hypothetical protein